VHTLLPLRRSGSAFGVLIGKDKFHIADFPGALSDCRPGTSRQAFSTVARPMPASSALAMTSARGLGPSASSSCGTSVARSSLDGASFLCSPAGTSSTV
jgi:hypothetical protein